MRVVGPTISLDDSLAKMKKDSEENVKELELILNLDDETFQNEFVFHIVEDAIEEAKEVLKKINQIEKAIIHWRALGKDTSKTYEEWSK